MGTLQNIRRKLPSFEFVDKPKKPKKTPVRDAWSQKSGGNVRCDNCGLWMAESSLAGHQARKHNLDTSPKKPPLEGGRLKDHTKQAKQTPKWGDNFKGADKKPKPKPKPAPKTNTFNKPGGDMPMNTSPIANSYANPATFGTGDTVTEIFNQWAERLPQNYLATRREAESMGEAMRGVADALRRRAHNMVDVIGVHPSTVEPYEEAAGQISQAADAFMEVANRIEAKYRQEIEFVNAKDTPNLNFLSEDGEH